MDSKFVEQNTTPKMQAFANQLKQITNIPLDIHLMVNHPIEYINKLIDLKPSIITVQHDSLDDLYEISNILKDNNIKMGIALNPNDDIYIINDYLDIIDLVLIMSVFPGKGGQKFIPSIPYKLEHLNKIKKDLNKDFLIEVDGGINDTTINEVNNLVDLAVSGSFICCSDDYEEKVNKLKNTLN